MLSGGVEGHWPPRQPPGSRAGVAATPDLPHAHPLRCARAGQVCPKGPRIVGHGSTQGSTVRSLALPWLNAEPEAAPSRRSGITRLNSCYTAPGTNATLYSCGTLDGDVTLAANSIHALGVCPDGQGGVHPPSPRAVFKNPDFCLLRAALKGHQPPTAANRQPLPTANRRQTANHCSILFLWSCVLSMS